RLLAGRQHTSEGCLGKRRPLGAGIYQVIAQAIFIEPAGLLARLAIIEFDPQARAQHGLGLEQVQQAIDIELGRIEVFAVGPEFYRSTRVALADRTDNLQFADLVAMRSE